MNTRKPIPAKERELFHQRIEAYDPTGKGFLQGQQPVRAERRSVKNDKAKEYSIGLKDIDETIVYYFNNIIRPSVIQNTKKINVPIIYGSPERWSAVQKDGYYRDKNGKIQAPLIMFKRESIEKNRNIGNKLDANNPQNIAYFKNQYSQKNFYDRFSVLTNRIPVDEYYGIIIPDYVNIQYRCIIFTDFIEQMNKIVESINFASDAYWGDPERFRFRAMIDSYTTSTELTQGEDRKVRTEFTINLLGYIIPNSINAQINGLNKIYSKSSIVFELEADGNLETITAKARTPEKAASTRFFDQPTGTGTSATAGLSSEQISFLAINNTAEADIITTNTATFSNYNFAEPPQGLSTGQDSFDVYVNGVLIQIQDRTVAESGNNVVVTFDTDAIGYPMDSGDQIIIVGKIQSV